VRRARRANPARTRSSWGSRRSPRSTKSRDLLSLSLAKDANDHWQPKSDPNWAACYVPRRHRSLSLVNIASPTLAPRLDVPGKATGAVAPAPAMFATTTRRDLA
jgi:hypothetical protein